MVEIRCSGIMALEKPVPKTAFGLVCLLPGLGVGFRGVCGIGRRGWGVGLWV